MTTAGGEELHPVGNSGFLTDLDVRIWLRDNDPGANLLLDDYELSAEELRTAMTLTVDYWNDQPPFIRCHNVRTFPWRSMMLKGTAANLLFIAANRYRRNALKYVAGGMSVADQEKYQEYDQAADKLWAEYRQWVSIQKRALNMECGWAML